MKYLVSTQEVDIPEDGINIKLPQYLSSFFIIWVIIFSDCES
jgi:hypothetical protein